MTNSEGILGKSNWEETPRQTQSILEELPIVQIRH